MTVTKRLMIPSTISTCRKAWVVSLLLTLVSLVIIQHRVLLGSQEWTTIPGDIADIQATNDDIREQQAASLIKLRDIMTKIDQHRNQPSLKEDSKGEKDGR